MSSPYDVLGDPTEYVEWLASLQPCAPEQDAGQDDVVQQLQDLPDNIAEVVSRLDHQSLVVILSAYQKLQVSRYASPVTVASVTMFTEMQTLSNLDDRQDTCGGECTPDAQEDLTSSLNR